MTSTRCSTRSSKTSMSTKWKRSATLTWSSAGSRNATASNTWRKWRRCPCGCSARSGGSRSDIDRTTRLNCASECIPVSDLWQDKLLSSSFKYLIYHCSNESFVFGTIYIIVVDIVYIVVQPNFRRHHDHRLLFRRRRCNTAV